MCGNIVECKFGERHMKYEHSCMEVLDQRGDPVPSGGTGRLVCTGFGNLAFPLVRYDIGEVVTVSRSQTAKCGRGGLLVDQVVGGAEDYIIGADGRMVGRLDYLFKDSENVIEARSFRLCREKLCCVLSVLLSTTPGTNRQLEKRRLNGWDRTHTLSLSTLTASHVAREANTNLWLQTLWVKQRRARTAHPRARVRTR
jgi:hypothetical protein